MKWRREDREQDVPRSAWRSAEFEAFPAGEDFQMVRLRRGTRVDVLPEFVVDFLRLSSAFKPLEEHIERHAEYFDCNAMQIEALRSWLPKLEERQLLVSSAAFLEKCRQGTGLKAGPIAMIGFPTANRVEMLQRGLESFIRNSQEHDREVQFVVADSSVDPSVRAAYREMLIETARRHRVVIQYSGEQEKREYVKTLAARSGCDPEAARFALLDPENCGFACGANRNVLLLQGTGRMLASIDDDIVCRITRPPGAQEGLKFFAGQDIHECHFFPDHQSAVRMAVETGGDFLGLHERLLGRTIGDALREWKETDVEDVSDEFETRALGGDGCVRATYFGHYGDSAVISSYHYLGSEGENFERLTSSEPAYRAALTSRSNFVSVPQWAVGDGTLCPGMAMGLDARTLLPPFFPVLHLEDWIFGKTLWRCGAGAFTGNVPCAVHHDPPGGKPIIVPGDLNEERRILIFEFASVVRSLILGYTPAPGAQTTADRIVGLGRYLREIGQGRSDDFLDRWRSEVLRYASRNAGALEARLLDQVDAPEFWRRDIEEFIAHKRTAASFDDFDVPHDLLAGRDPSQARELMQRLILRFGILLEAWPALVAAAGELAQQGIQPAQAMIP